MRDAQKENFVITYGKGESMELGKQRAVFYIKL